MIFLTRRFEDNGFFEQVIPIQVEKRSFFCRFRHKRFHYRVVRLIHKCSDNNVAVSVFAVERQVVMSLFLVLMLILVRSLVVSIVFFKEFPKRIAHILLVILSVSNQFIHPQEFLLHSQRLDKNQKRHYECNHSHFENFETNVGIFLTHATFECNLYLE